MQTVKKFFIPDRHFGEPFTINMEDGAEILDVQMQRGRAVMWALCPGLYADRAVRFVVFGTSHSLPPEIRATDYVKTWQNESMVHHLFRAPRV